MIRATSDVLTAPTFKILLQLIFPPIHTYSAPAYIGSLQLILWYIVYLIFCTKHLYNEPVLFTFCTVVLLLCCNTLCTFALLPLHCVLLHCCAGSGGLIPVIPFQVLPHLAIFTTCPKIVHRTSSPLVIFILMVRRTHSDIERYVFKQGHW